MSITSCHSHNAGLQPTDGSQPPSLSDLAEANAGRLSPTPSGTVYEVAGNITISGFTLQDGTGTAVPGQPSANTRILAQLIDEEDDILVARNPSLAGNFSLPYGGPLTSVKLRVLAKVAEDLDGDGKGGDQLQQVVPVLLVSGYKAQANLALKRGTTADADVSLRPTVGQFVVNTLSLLDGSGKLNSFYGTFFAASQVVITKDGDKFLEMGDDLVQPDLDHNGWPDPDEQSYADAPGVAELLTGTVKSVDLAEQTLLVADVYAVTTLVHLSAFCAIETFTSNPGGNGVGGDFYGGRQLSTDLIGKSVTITGRYDGPGFIADWIVVAAGY